MSHLPVSGTMARSAFGGGAMAEAAVTFADLLRQLRGRARLTQDELAEAAGVSFRTVSDLERAVAVSPQRETVRRRAGGRHLVRPERTRLEAAARGRTRPGEPAPAAAEALRSLPRDV